MMTRSSLISEIGARLLKGVPQLAALLDSSSGEFGGYEITGKIVIFLHLGKPLIEYLIR